MNQRRARAERQFRKRLYAYELMIWQKQKPPWWRFLARRKWKAEKPRYIRRIRRNQR